MWKLVVLLVVILAAASGKELKNLKGKVTKGCMSEMSKCGSRTLSQNRCRSVWNSLLLQMVKSDTNNDCVVDEDDMERFYKIYMDTNGDKKVCLDEWKSYMTYNFGFTEQFAIANFQKKKHVKGNCADIDDLEEVQDMKLKTTFKYELIKDLVAFCDNGNNLQTNRDCWGLVSLCDERFPSLGICKTFNLRGEMPLFAKIQEERNFFDGNNDGVITASEVTTILQNEFDTNHDNCISPSEWTQHYQSKFKLSAKFAVDYFNVIKDPRVDCVNVNEMLQRASSIHSDNRPIALIKAIISMCEKDTKRYKTVMECASVPETCRMHFPTVRECANFLEPNCGLKSFSECLKGLTIANAACSKEADKFEVKFENLKIGNQINTTCVANNINSSNVLKGSPLFIMLIVLLLAYLL